MGPAGRNEDGRLLQLFAERGGRGTGFLESSGLISAPTFLCLVACRPFSLDDWAPTTTRPTLLHTFILLHRISILLLVH
jgi:hypothetical protein